jgi:hypothetical protein
MDIMSPRQLKIANWVVLVILVAAGYLWQGREFGLGVLVGGLVAVINFHLLHRTLKNTLERAGANAEEAKAQAKAWFAGRQLLRFFALVAIIFVLVSRGWVNIFGLVAGLSTVVLTLILAAINEIFKLKNKEANPSHGTSHSLP